MPIAFMTIFQKHILTPLILYFIMMIISILLPLSLSLSSTTLRGTGRWEVLHENIGISPIHMQLLHNNKVVMFDRTDFGPSNLSLPRGHCRYDPYDTALQFDCTAHSILYDIKTNAFRSLMLQTDAWCSSGSVLPNGTLVQTGGFNDGERRLRMFTPCANNGHCDWIEFDDYLHDRRWYATNLILPDGKIIIVGGRRQFSYEFYPKNRGLYTANLFRFNFLRETRDDSVEENNLYPFLHLLPDGNLFIFANTRSISLDYVNNRVVKEFPRVPYDDPRNYPSSGSSVLLPLRYQDGLEANIEAEVLICGGAPRRSFTRAGDGRFLRAINTCGRLKVTDEDPEWVMEQMPIRRVMGDMLILPTGDVIIINGAGSGTAGWELGRNPVTRPVIYRTYERSNRRFSVMRRTFTPRLYHSSAVLLPDGRVLVGGSNPNRYYNFTGVLYPTDLSLEAYSPPYLSSDYDETRPGNVRASVNVLTYGESFTVTFTVQRFLSASEVSVTILAPSFTTHSFGMNQRMVVLNVIAMRKMNPSSSRRYRVNVVGPPTAEIAPRGYYVLFVVHGGVPSHGAWVKLQ